MMKISTKPYRDAGGGSVVYDTVCHAHTGKGCYASANL